MCAACAVLLLLQVCTSSSAIAQTAGGLNPREMELARKTVDPEGKLTDSQRTLAALGSIYQYWANKGEPEKAQRVAFQLLQHYRLVSQRYAAIAGWAKQQGHMNLATGNALKSYTNLPDGRDARLTFDNDSKRVIYHYVDASGKAASKVIVSPQQLASSAMGLSLDGFDDALLLAAKQIDGAPRRAGITPGNGLTGNRPPQVFEFPPLPAEMSPDELAPASKRLSPSVNCVTLKQELGGSSTTHCTTD